MTCPYCGSPANATATGNGGELFVGEDEECFDWEIDLFECSFDKKHYFYAKILGKKY